MNKLNVKALAVAFGTAWSFCILLAGWFAIFGWSTKFVDIMGGVYLGYEATFIGAVIGALWAFLDGAILGLIIALIYNAVAKAK